MDKKSKPELEKRTGGSFSVDRADAWKKNQSLIQALTLPKANSIPPAESQTANKPK